MTIYVVFNGTRMVIAYVSEQNAKDMVAANDGLLTYQTVTVKDFSPAG